MGMFVCLKGLFELTACAVFYPEYIPRSYFAATLTLTACSSFSGSKATENYRNISTSVDSPFTLTLFFTLLFSSFHDLFSLFITYFPSCIAFASSDLFSVSDSSPVRGIQTQTLRWRIVWMGWSRGCPKAKVLPRISQMTAAWRVPGQYKSRCYYYHLRSS